VRNGGALAGRGVSAAAATRSSFVCMASASARVGSCARKAPEPAPSKAAAVNIAMANGREGRIE
jgi:hypothetical protein